VFKKHPLLLYSIFQQIIDRYLSNVNTIIAESLLIANVIIYGQRVPFFSNTSMKSRAPLSDGRIGDRLVEVIARFNNALSQLIDISNVKILSVHSVLHYTPYLIVHQVKVQTVWGTMVSAR